MHPRIERRIADQRGEDVRRLADQGERNNVRILVDAKTGEHVATSASDPTRCYHVSVAGGCTCRGFTYWGRCQHHSLLLSELGLIQGAGEDELVAVLWGDVDIEPAPPARPAAKQYIVDRPHAA